MDPLVGLGVSVFFGFLRYRVNAVLKPVASTGMVIGALVMGAGFLPESYRPPILVILLLVVGVLSLTGAGYLYWQHMIKKSPQAATNSPPEFQGQGGHGGDAKVGGSGIAIGGPGGHAGKGGRGGDGGGGEVKGDGVAAGGAGGHAGDVGVWRPPAKSGYEVYQRAMGLPVDPALRGFGRGGAGAGYEPKLKIVEELRVAYFRDHAKPFRTVFEDINAVPLEYLNDALAATGEVWRVRIVDDEYEFYIPSARRALAKKICSRASAKRSVASDLQLDHVDSDEGQDASLHLDGGLESRLRRGLGLGPARAEFFLRGVERRLAAVAHALNRRVHVYRDRPEPSQRRQRTGVLVDAPDRRAVVENDPVGLVAVGRRGEPGRAQAECHRLEPLRLAASAGRVWE